MRSIFSSCWCTDRAFPYLRKVCVCGGSCWGQGVREGGAGGGDCIEKCEYDPCAELTPPMECSDLPLNAVVKWQWGYAPAPTEFANKADVWSTPVVARVFDANCDVDCNKLQTNLLAGTFW